jgi:hypothetical protein
MRREETQIAFNPLRDDAFVSSTSELLSQPIRFCLGIPIPDSFHGRRHGIPCSDAIAIDDAVVREHAQNGIDVSTLSWNGLLPKTECILNAGWRATVSMVMPYVA